VERVFTYVNNFGFYHNMVDIAIDIEEISGVYYPSSRLKKNI